ncbi:MAG: hypothetical protein FD123_1494 [Bacteroidetes bacterium]|nr:MAG: hypothetical protein FD123_1494 [Bacteroidota bacterium]
MLILILSSCGAEHKSGQDTAQKPVHKQADTAQTKSASTDTVAYNQRDQLGCKQGKWFYQFQGNDGYQYWKNDTLNGYFRQWYKDSTEFLVIEGYYKNGQFDGLQFRFDAGVRLPRTAFFYREGKVLWSVFVGPEAIYTMHIKGIGISTDDSTFIDCPYGINQKTFYQGWLVNKKPVGIHKNFREDGTLRYDINYDKKMIYHYDRNGKILRKVSTNGSYDLSITFPEEEDPKTK